MSELPVSLKKMVIFPSFNTCTPHLPCYKKCAGRRVLFFYPNFIDMSMGISIFS